MIRLTVDQLIDAGAWADIYQLSPHRIIKVFRNIQDADKLIKDEVTGSKRYKHALPILRIVSVVDRHGRKTKGIVRKYLPHKVTRGELLALYNNRRQNMPWDGNVDNFRKDRDGTIYMIDTQLLLFEGWDEL
jgi:hypothetical protein